MSRKGAAVAGFVALALASGVALLLFRGEPRREVPPEVPRPAAGGPAGSPAAPPPPSPQVPADPPAGAEPPAPSPTAPASGGVLVVTVVGLPSGAPVEGARVEVRRHDDGDRVVGFRTTGADGVARFEGLQPDFVAVRTTAPGRVPRRSGVSDLRKPGVRSITVDLEPGVALGGIVLDEGSRRPVAGAKVVAEKGGKIEGMSTFYSGGAELMETTADAEGRFRVEGIPRKEIVTLSAAAPGFVRAKRSLMLGEGAEEHPEVEIVLPRAVTAAGVVLDPDGRAVAGASVGAFAEEEKGADRSLASLEAEQGPWGAGLGAACKVKTGEDGRFRIEGLPVGVPHRFCARAPGFARSALTDPPRTADAPGQEIRVELRLRRPAILRVRVADPEGKAIEGAGALIAVGHGGELAPEAEGGGSFRFDALLAGEYRVEAEAPGRRGAEAAVALAEAETREIRIVLHPEGPAVPSPTEEGPKPGKVRLRLVPPPGTDLPARFTIAVEEIRSGGGTGYTRPLKDGLVEVGDVPPEPVRLVVSVEGFAPVVREVELRPGEERDLGDIAVDLGVEFAGAVQDAAGSPLAGARVRVQLPGFMDSAVATTGSDGRFRISRIPPGERQVRVAAPGLLESKETVVIGPGTTNRSYTLVPAVAVRGTLRTGEGKAVEGVRVAFLLQSEAPPGVPREEIEFPDDEGSFRIKVAAGAYVVEVRDGKGGVLLRQEAAFDGKGEGRLDLVVP